MVIRRINKTVQSIRYPKRKDENILTLNQFLQNPTGKYSAFLSRRDQIKKDLEFRYNKLNRNYRQNIKLKIFKIKDDYFFYYHIPSEDMGNNLYYDVVIKFEPPNDEVKEENTLSNYNIKLFSNSPNFTFTYTYVIYNSNLLVEELMSKCNTRALRERPKMRNPIEAMGFEKSCYFAALNIKSNRYIFKSNIDNRLTVFDKRNSFNPIKTDNEKLDEYNRVKASRRTKKR